MDVGVDASGSEYFPTVAQGAVHRGVHVEGVGIAAVERPADMVEIVSLNVAVLERTLYHPPRWGMVSRYRNADGRTVYEGNLLLDEPFAEARLTDDDAAVPVLYGSGYNLAARCRRRIYQYHEPAFGKRAGPARFVTDVPDIPPFGGDDYRACRQEELAHLYRLVQEASAVAAQVEDKCGERAEPVETLSELLHGRTGEAVDSDVSDAGSGHVGGIYRMDGDIIARDIENQVVRFSPSLDAELYPAPLGAAEQFRNVGTAYADRRFAVHRYDAVVGQYPDALGRAARDGVYDDDGIVDDVEFHADAAETPVEGFRDAFISSAEE